MQYKLRLTAVNVVGASPPSEPTKDFQTIQAPPKHSPKNVTVRAVSATELRVRWIVSRNFHCRLRFINFSNQPLQQLEWFGNPRGYNISSTTLDGISKIFIIEDHTANSHILSNLEESTEYFIQMCAFNDVGASGLSPPAKERTRESGRCLFFTRPFRVLLIDFLGQFRHPVLITWRPTLPLPPQLLSNGETCRKGMKMVSSRASKFSTELYPKSRSRYWIAFIHSLFYLILYCSTEQGDSQKLYPHNNIDGAEEIRLVQHTSYGLHQTRRRSSEHASSTSQNFWRL